jgi:hypothetical protein
LRVRLDLGLFGRILSVGLVASAMAAIANLTTVLVTALVSRHGSAAIAAYGVGVRLEFLMIPLAYGIGAALTALVGLRVGAGDWAGARITAWRGAAMAGAIAGAVGAAVALAHTPLARAFATDPEVRAAIGLYLVLVGPAFPGSRHWHGGSISPRRGRGVCDSPSSLRSCGSRSLLGAAPGPGTVSVSPGCSRPSPPLSSATARSSPPSVRPSIWSARGR